MILRTFVISALLSLGALGAPPLFETTLVSPVAPGNKPNYRISAIVQVPNGDVLIIAERRNDGIGDIGDHDIVMKRSRDKGKTWGAEQMIFDDGTDTSTDLTVGLDRTNGKLWLFSCGIKSSTTISRAATTARRGWGRFRSTIKSPSRSGISSRARLMKVRILRAPGAVRFGQRAGASVTAAGRAMR